MYGLPPDDRNHAVSQEFDNVSFFQTAYNNKQRNKETTKHRYQSCE